MLEQVIRPHYQRFFVDPIAQKIKYFFTSMQITLLGGIFGLGSAIAIGCQFGKLGIVLLLISGYCDTLDGTIARANSSTSDLGSVLDIMTDRLIEFAVVIGLWAVLPEERSLICLFMLGSILLCVTSFLVVGIFSSHHSEKSFYYSPGLIERAEAFIFFILMIIFPNYFTELGVVFIFLVFLTTIIRIAEFAKSHNNYN